MSARLAIAIALAGCGSSRASAESAARDELSKQHSCPADRITTAVRSDLKPFALGGVTRDVPPPDVAKDPGRLEVWNAKQREIEDGYDNFTIVEARGCDQHVFYLCGWGMSGESQVMVCQPARKQPT